MNRSEKEAVVANVAERLDRTKALVLTDFAGLKVEKMTELRQKLRDKDLEYLVVKNTLLNRAAEGKPAKELFSTVAGPTGVAFSYGDPVELAKTITDFVKDNPKLEVKSGLLEGKVITAEEVVRLAKLPGREELLAQILGAMNGVPRGFVTVLAGVIRALLNALKAIEEQKAEKAA